MHIIAVNVPIIAVVGDCGAGVALVAVGENIAGGVITVATAPADGLACFSLSASVCLGDKLAIIIKKPLRLDDFIPIVIDVNLAAVQPLCNVCVCN